MEVSAWSIIPPPSRVRLDNFEIIARFGLLIASVALLLGNFDHNKYHRGDGTFKNNTGGRYGNGSTSGHEVGFGQVDLSTPPSHPRVFRVMQGPSLPGQSSTCIRPSVATRRGARRISGKAYDVNFGRLCRGR
jgi:hypothetical protein